MRYDIHTIIKNIFMNKKLVYSKPIYLPTPLMLPRELIMDNEITRMDIKLYAMLDAIYKNNGTINITNKGLSKLINVHTKSIQRSLENLESKNFIKRTDNDFFGRTIELKYKLTNK